MAVRIITKMLVQDAVYWGPSGGSDVFGKPTPASPISIKCRWTDIIEEILLPDGRTYTSQSKVYVDRDLLLGGVLCQGKLAALVDPVTPFNNPGAVEIKKLGKLPTLKGDQFLRTVWL